MGPATEEHPRHGGASKDNSRQWDHRPVWLELREKGWEDGVARRLTEYVLF